MRVHELLFKGVGDRLLEGTDIIIVIIVRLERT